MNILRCPECGSSNIKKGKETKRCCEECGLNFEDNQDKQIIKNKFNWKPLSWAAAIFGISLLGRKKK